MGELTDIDAGGRQTRTLAVEAEDPAAVWASVTALGLAERVNTSVPRGLLALVNDERPRYAVIDVGTNSVKFHVGEQTDDGRWRRVVDRAETTRLGDGLATSGTISAAAVERTTAAIAGMVEEASRASRPGDRGGGHGGAARRPATGTRSWPRSSRRQESPSHTISGEEESRLAYLAVRAELGSGEGTLVVFDTGGGSSQFTFGQRCRGR